MGVDVGAKASVRSARIGRAGRHRARKGQWGGQQLAERRAERVARHAPLGARILCAVGRARAAQGLERQLARGELVGADHQGDARAAAVRALEPGLHAAAAEIVHHRRAAVERAHRLGQGHRVRGLDLVGAGQEHVRGVRRGGGAERLHERATTRSMPSAQPTPAPPFAPKACTRSS